MFASRILVVVVAVAVGAFAALSAARPTEGAGAEIRYRVQPGDTLWEVASQRYSGDPREAIWEIKQRNGLETSALLPGMVLYLPP
jgi:nucleoid-associated protein YgaU